jgi:hypothetical protein
MPTAVPDAFPPFHPSGDLPGGVFRATLKQVVERFGGGTLQRLAVANRPAQVYCTARSTGFLARFVVYGSFVTQKRDPNDVDVFLIMEDSFDLAQVTGEARLLFDHLAAQAHFGASVFWVRRLGCLGGEQAAIEHWQTKRDRGKRGIVEIVEETL